MGTKKGQVRKTARRAYKPKRTLNQQRLREAKIKAARTSRMQKRYGMSSSSILQHFNINISQILRGDRRRSG